MCLTIPRHITWKDLDNALVLLNLNSSEYYTLNETAAQIWRDIQGGLTEVKIIAAMCEKYDIKEEDVVADVREQLRFLVDEGLVIETQAPTSLE